MRINLKVFTVILISGIAINGISQEFDWSPQTSGTNQYLNDIYFTDQLNGWAVGTNGAVVATTDGGANWSLQTSGTGEELRSVFFLNPEIGWIAGGTDGPVMLMTEDGGATWSPTTIDLPGASYFKAVQFADPMTGFAIDTSDIYESIDGGLTWEKGRYSSLIIDVIQIEGLYVLPDNSAFACGYYRNKSNDSLSGIFENLTLPNGQWLPQDIGEAGVEERLVAIHFTGAPKGFTGSSTGRIYSMQEEGGIFPGSWTLNFDTGKGKVSSIAFSTDTHGMFNVTSENGSEIYQLIYHTTDSGVSWSSIPDTIAELHMASLATPDVNHAWIAGNNGIIYKGARQDPVSATTRDMLEFSIHPNPFSSWIEIESPGTLRNATYEIFDYTGKSIRSGRLGDAEKSHTLSGLETLDHGIYFLRVRSPEGGLVATRKMIKY